MRLKFLILATFATATLAAHADTIYGPITLGNNTPLTSDGYISLFSLLPTYAPGISLDNPAGKTDDSFSQTIAFSFKLAPSFQITNLTFSDFTDWSPTPPTLDDPSKYAYEFKQKITLCSSTGVCSSASTGDHLGGFLLPSITLNNLSGTNIGFYQAAGYSHNAQVATEPLDSNVNILLAPTAAPEPSTLLLIGTGVLALATSLRHRISKLLP
jgi:PEP-CTERM motif